jgi:hypothetical protein
MGSPDENLYIATATVADFARWLFENGHLNFELATHAQQLGESFFDERAADDRAPRDWRDKAHVDLFDWA